MAAPHPLSVDPLEAMRFLARKVDVPTRAWTDIWQEAHSVAFVVAGAQSRDLLADFRGAVNRAIAEGRTLAQFRGDFDRIVQEHGWSYHGSRNWRSKVIYQTNMRTAYAAGRWEQIQRLKAVRPYLRYVHVDPTGVSKRNRRKHQEWHDTVLPVDHPWWQTHYPPNEWGCRCTAMSLSERDLARYGLRVSAAPPPTQMVARRVNTPDGPMTVEVPEGIDPGFAYRIGAPPSERLRRSLIDRGYPAPEIPPAPPPPVLPPPPPPVSPPSAAGRPLDRISRQAVDDVVAAGRRDGREHLVATDGTSVLGRSRGERSRVDLPPSLGARIADPAEKLTIVHNHPGGTGLSAQDVHTFATAPGLYRLGAYGPQGQAYMLARTGPVPPDAGAEYLAMRQRLGVALHEARLLDRMAPYVAHLITLALARRGWWHYSARLDRAGERLIAQHRAIIEAAIGPIGE